MKRDLPEVKAHRSMRRPKRAIRPLARRLYGDPLRTRLETATTRRRRKRNEQRNRAKGAV